MSSLYETLRRRALDVFDTKELGEPLLALYQNLGLALRDNTDALLLNKLELTHLIDRQATKHLPMIYGDVSLYEIFRKNLLLIFQRDDLVNKYFRLAHVDDENVFIEVIKPNDT